MVTTIISTLVAVIVILGGVAAFTRNLKSDIRADVSRDILSVRTDLSKDILSVRTDLGRDISALRGDTASLKELMLVQFRSADQRAASMEASLNRRIDDLRQDLSHPAE